MKFAHSLAFENRRGFAQRIGGNNYSGEKSDSVDRKSDRFIDRDREYEKKMWWQDSGRKRFNAREKFTGDGSNAQQVESFRKVPTEKFQKAFTNREKHTISFSNGE